MMGYARFYGYAVSNFYACGVSRCAVSMAGAVSGFLASLFGWLRRFRFQVVQSLKFNGLNG